eukprot:NODE_3_length_80033_cov_0.932970.p47 type:complete len:220 gc:universal NODE_3_length_80033_cov_0.932970:55934-55275(-)
MVDRMNQLNSNGVDRSNSLIKAEEGGVSNEFLKRIEHVKGLLNKLKTLVDKVDDSHNRSLQAVSDEDSKKTRDIVEQLMVDISGVNFEIRKILKDMDAENKDLEKAGKNNTNDFRIRVTQHGLVAKQFQEQVQKYNDTQNKFKDRYKTKIEKQYKIIKPGATKEELDNVVNSPNPDALFSQQVLLTYIDDGFFSKGSPKSIVRSTRASSRFDENREITS